MPPFRTLLFVLAFFGAAAFEDPTPQQLAREAMDNGRRMAANATEYTADYRHIYRYFSKAGKLDRETTTTGETYQSSSRNVDIELTRDGKPVKDKSIEKNRAVAGRELQADYDARVKRMAEARLGAPNSTAVGTEYGIHFGNVHMDYYSILREFDLRNLRRDVWHGREVFVMDFEPRPGYQPARKDQAHLPGIRGTLWIDAIDRVVVEWHAAIAQGPRAGTVFFEQEFERTADGWQGRRARINLASDQVLFAREPQIEWIVETSNRKRFGVQAESQETKPR